MKTFVTFILALIFPLFAMTQSQIFQSIKLKTLDERTVVLEDIFQDNNLTIIYFFSESCRNLTDQFDYLQGLAEEYQNIKLKIIAVYNASNNSYGHVKSFINGNDISLETFIDVNGELQRAMGLPVNSTMLLTWQSNMPKGHCLESVSYSPEQADIELMQILSSDYLNSYNDQYLSGNFSVE